METSIRTWRSWGDGMESSCRTWEEVIWRATMIPMSNRTGQRRNLLFGSWRSYMGEWRGGVALRHDQSLPSFHQLFISKYSLRSACGGLAAKYVGAFTGSRPGSP